MAKRTVGYIDSIDSSINVEEDAIVSSVAEKIRETLNSGILSTVEKEMLLRRFGIYPYTAPTLLPEMASLYTMSIEKMRMRLIKIHRKLEKHFCGFK